MQAWAQGLWSAVKGVVNEALVALIVPWGLRQLRLTPCSITPI